MAASKIKFVGGSLFGLLYFGAEMVLGVQKHKAYRHSAVFVIKYSQSEFKGKDVC